MATVAHKAFYAQLHGLAGVITKPAGNVLFLDTTTGAVVTLTPADSAALVILGAVETTMAQYLEDMAAGGYAAVVCSRAQEVA
jgi:hypothetical protein